MINAFIVSALDALSYEVMHFCTFNKLLKNSTKSNFVSYIIITKNNTRQPIIWQYCSHIYPMMLPSQHVFIFKRLERAIHRQYVGVEAAGDDALYSICTWLFSTRKDNKKIGNRPTNDIV